MTVLTNLLRSLHLRGYRRILFVPRSGYAPKPRVASTLGKVSKKTPTAARLRRSSEVARAEFLTKGLDATRSGLNAGNVVSPGLKQPWALGRNRFAVQEALIPQLRRHIPHNLQISQCFKLIDRNSSNHEFRGFLVQYSLKTKHFKF
jgi:hypothetical protein